jgi:hypothetical protein
MVLPDVDVEAIQDSYQKAVLEEREAVRELKKVRCRLNIYPYTNSYLHDELNDNQKEEHEAAKTERRKKADVTSNKRKVCRNNNVEPKEPPTEQDDKQQLCIELAHEIDCAGHVLPYLKSQVDAKKYGKPPGLLNVEDIRWRRREKRFQDAQEEFRNRINTLTDYTSQYPDDLEMFPTVPVRWLSLLNGEIEADNEEDWGREFQ